MIPIIYSSAETAFTSNGIGRLVDATECKVKEKRNGEYTLTLKYPTTGQYYDYLVEGNYISAIHDDTKTRQPFEIWKISKPIDGLVTIYANHISYQLSKYVLAPMFAGSCAAAIAAIPNNMLPDDGGFTFWTDKVVTASFATTIPISVRSALGGTAGSVLDVFGTGEYEWDGKTVKLHLHRGSDSGVMLRYGKDLSDMTAEYTSDLLYGVVPYYQDEETTVVGDPVYSPSASGTGNIEPHDFSSSFNSAPTQAELEAAALTYIINYAVLQSKTSIEVDFVALWQTEQYESVAPLQRLKLCDTVSVYHSGLGVLATGIEIVEVTYNVLLERYDNMVLGEPTTTLSSTMSSNIVSEVTKTVPTKSYLAAAISAATNALRGGAGGHIVIVTNANGQPTEILAMDTDDITTAVNVVRINSAGIGISTTGYNGTYGTAMTIDGHIVADFIDTGTLTANIITAGILTDDEGKNSWNLDTGEFKLAISSDISTLSNTITDNYSSLSDQINDTNSTINTLSGTVGNNSTSITQLQTSLDAVPGQITAVVSAATDELSSAQEGMQETLDQYASVFAFRADGFYIGETGSDTYLKLDSGQIMFWSTTQDSWLSKWVEDVFYITDVVASNSLAVGHLKFLPRSNGTVDVVFS